MASEQKTTEEKTTESTTPVAAPTATPAASSGKKVTLLSSDDQKFAVAVEIATVSVTLKNMLDDIGDSEAPIPLPNVSAKILTKVIEWIEYHRAHPEEDEKLVKQLKKKPINPNTKIEDMMIPFDIEFCKVDPNTLYDLILAANYLDIKPLLEATCKTVANKIKGRTPEEIRKEFNLRNDFTPEEEEQIRKENEWSEDK